MERRIFSTHCSVTITAPSGLTIDFDSQEPQEDLLMVETDNDMNQATGSFTLHFAPRRIDGKLWSDRIPARSLVRIKMERDAPDATTRAGDNTVMLGLTSDHGTSGSYQRREPQQQVLVRGKMMSCVLMDAQLFYSPYLSLNPELASLTIESATFGPQKLAFMWDPDLAKAGESPQANIERILRYFLLGEGVKGQPASQRQAAIIQMQFADQTLGDLLKLNTETWNTFEPVISPIASNMVRAGSIWNYVHIFVDRYFQEWFSRVEDGVCKLFFRGKPFKHEVVETGTRFLDSDPTLETLFLPQSWILSEQFHRTTDTVLNGFWVMPLGASTWAKAPGLKWLVPPEFIKDPKHPSFIGKYSPHVLEVNSPYLSVLESTSSSTIPAATNAPSAPLAPRASQIKADRQQYVDAANRIGAEEGIPAQHLPWFVGLIEAESGFNPHPPDSPDGAQGIAQFIPSTAARFGLTNPYDPIASLHAAGKYWQELRANPSIGDNPELIVAGYHSGADAVEAAGGRVPPFPRVTRHVAKVKTFSEKYGSLTSTATPSSAPPPPSLATAASGAQLDELRNTTKRWSHILRAWYGEQSELVSGIIQVVGHRLWNMGHRLVTVDERGEREFYIEGVNHQYDFRVPRSGAFTSRLRVSRGWYLQETIEDRSAATVPVSSVSGGPPPFDDPAEAHNRRLAASR